MDPVGTLENPTVVVKCDVTDSGNIVDGLELDAVVVEPKSELMVVISAGLDVDCTVGRTSKAMVGLVNSMVGHCVDLTSLVTGDTGDSVDDSPGRVVDSDRLGGDVPSIRGSCVDPFSLVTEGTSGETGASVCILEELSCSFIGRLSIGSIEPVCDADSMRGE